MRFLTEEERQLLSFPDTVVTRFMVSGSDKIAIIECLDAYVGVENPRRRNIEYVTVKIQHYSSLAILDCNNQTVGYVDKLALKDVCEFEYSECNVILRGFTKAEGNWIEYRFVGGETTVSFERYEVDDETRDTVAKLLRVDSGDFSPKLTIRVEDENFRKAVVERFLQDALRLNKNKLAETPTGGIIELPYGRKMPDLQLAVNSCELKLSFHPGKHWDSRMVEMFLEIVSDLKRKFGVTSVRLDEDGEFYSKMQRVEFDQIFRDVL